MRSEPLILNKKGKLKYPLSIQKGKKKARWKVIIVTFDGKRRSKVVRRYPDAKSLVKKVMKAHPDVECTIVSRQVGYGPPASKISDAQLWEQNERGRFWCPYCRKFRIFEWDHYYGITRCPVCRCMDNNYHVIANNPILSERLWGSS